MHSSILLTLLLGLVLISTLGTTFVFGQTDCSQEPIPGADFSGCKLQDADFSDKVLTNVDFSDADLSDVNFQNTDLANADLSNAKLTSANLRDADLSGAKLVNADLTNAILTNADLTEADATNSILRNANLERIDARKAIFKNVEFREAKLNNADFSGASLVNADLTGADWGGANFKGTDFSGAKIKDEIIQKINLFNAQTDETTIFAEGSGGCLIATAAFGSELSPQVQQLREIRDNVVMQTKTGLAFMTGFNQIYYSFSPTIADWERENSVFREIVKITITPMLSSLSILNYVNIDSEEEMLGYGISVILLNIGTYIGIPVFAILQTKKFINKKFS